MSSPTALLRPGEIATDAASLCPTDTSSLLAFMDSSNPFHPEADSSLPFLPTRHSRPPHSSSSALTSSRSHLPLWKHRKPHPSPSDQENMLSPSTSHPAGPPTKPLLSPVPSRLRPALAPLPLNRPTSHPVARKQWSKGVEVVPAISPDSSFSQDDDLPLTSPSPLRVPRPLPHAPSDPSSDSVKVRLIESLQAELLAFRTLPSSPPAQSQVDSPSSEVTRLRVEVEALTRQVVEGRSVRRVLTSQLMEVKGSVRVLCRIRACPPSHTSTLSVRRGEGKEVVTVRAGDGVGVDETGCPRLTASFSFDRVFPALPSRSSLHEELLPYFTSAVSGVSATVCLHGRRESGRTDAMWEEEGGEVVGAALRVIWTEVEAARVAGSPVLVRLSCVEVNEEGVLDLLSPALSPCDCVALPAVPVDQCGGCMALLDAAHTRRTLECSRLSATSSRGHTVIRLHFPASSLTLVELAGSERAEAGGVIQEAGVISASLSALRSVVEALHRRDGNVPYGESMLTRVMEAGLRGDGRMVVVVCVRGEGEWVGATSRTLAFGEQLRTVGRRGRIGEKDKCRSGKEVEDGVGQLPVLVGNVIKRQRRA